ncbi:MAG TPA: ATP-binding protein [Thermomicrobiales bacterium]|nr:ATP-binding protein [Thermomicrobiales bacterium]
MDQRDDLLGVVTEGSFSAGLTVRLDGPLSDDLQVGSFVVLEGGQRRYFSLINDLQLRSTDPSISNDPPTDSDFLRDALRGIHTFTAATVRPSLVIEHAGSILGDPKPRAVRTIPSHFAQMRSAREEDFNLVFGAEDGDNFSIGYPVAGKEIGIPINLRKLVERPSGIFGQTGTGKSVLTRLILFGLIRSDIASALVFDMHDEYADERSDKPGVPGLRDLFDSTRVKVYGLDKSNSRVDYHITIGMNHITSGDIELLRDVLDLSDTFSATTYLLEREYQTRWLSALLNMDTEALKSFVSRTGAHEGAVEALRRKLQYLEGCEFVIESSTADPVRDIVHHLEAGRHVVIQFGRFHALRDYMLVTNLLTRRIHKHYTDRAMSRRGQAGSGGARPVVVVLEEAHKFLSPTAARQSIFGTIAREMRKFDVSLMVVDQRPSQIDSEVMSQLATRVSGLLTDESDIAAVLSGTGDRSALRAMLSSLEPSRQCIVMGHAIPMPMLLRTREYGRSLAELASAGRPDTRAGLRLLMGPAGEGVG